MRRIECRREFFAELVGLLKPEERWTVEELDKVGLLMILPVLGQDHRYVMFIPEEPKVETI